MQEIPLHITGDLASTLINAGAIVLAGALGAVLTLYGVRMQNRSERERDDRQRFFEARKKIYIEILSFPSTASQTRAENRRISMGTEGNRLMCELNLLASHKIVHAWQNLFHVLSENVVIDPKTMVPTTYRNEMDLHKILTDLMREDLGIEFVFNPTELPRG